MEKKTFAQPAAALAAFALLATAALHPQAPTATLTIHADQPIHAVSPTLYGLMTEEINYSYDGGLYAEMVRNRTFGANWDGIQHWYLVEQGNAHAAITADKETGPSDALPSSLRIDVKQAGTHNQAGVLNDGWWGMPLRPNTTYKGSFYAKADGKLLLPYASVHNGTVTAEADQNAPGEITISLVNDHSGKVIATTTVPPVNTSWRKYAFTLKTGAIEPSAANHLEITVAHPGTLWLNLVSLFPPTYHDRANGNRIDLMEKMAAMHPTFLRFPGGNYLEGDHINERYEWKKTIGPLVDRPTHPSPWRYHSSDGLGLLEFLDWCEDLKIQPVLAVYAGYSMAQEHVEPGPALEPYIQDALDEIEYVTGGTDTKWGASRAQNGHPEPFKLTYVEIGNEDWFDKSNSYDGRYTQFYNAIKTKYPALQLIATAPVKSVKPDVIDEHYYVRATQFFQDASHYDPPTSGSAPRWESGHYDKADRNGPKIFVGEWATREGSPTPNFGAALGDAAWMTGLERNSDIVIMASYAPLLVNVNPGGMQWETDLIGYDAMRSYGSPSYWAQVIFAKYLGDQTLGSKLEEPALDPANPRFFYSITRDSTKNRLYLKLVNASSTPQPIEINLPGAKLAETGRLISLSALSTQATNTIDQPHQIVPVESALQGVSDHFRHTVPGYAIQVIEFNQK
jgi:alpha-N-arabinofuranosidase